MKLSKKYLALGLIGSVLTAGSAFAATQSVTASMAFDAALALALNSNINFGTVQAGIAGATYTMSTAGVVTPSAGGIVVNSTGQAAGSISVTGSATQTVAISTGAYIANGGVTLSAATCAYNGGASTACDGGLAAQAAPGAGGRTLLLGVQAVSDGTAAAGTTATPSFTVTVIYG